MKFATPWILMAPLWLAGMASTFAQVALPHAEKPAISNGQGPRLVSEFAAFAGSESNAQSLVAGLRQGSTITLVEPPTATQPQSEIAFVPPTRPMGYGNVSHALALARTQLARHGITDPTTEQVRVALMGGTIVTGNGATATKIQMQGILQMRADGMGWGRIAHSMGVKLGHVVSEMKTSNTHASKPSAAAATRDVSGVTNAAGSGTKSVATGKTHARPGIVTAAGTSAAGAGTTARIHHGGGAAGSTGVVTAAGAPGGHASAVGQAHGKGHSKP